MPKKFWVQKQWPKKFRCRKVFDPRNFRAQNVFGTKCFWYKMFLIQNVFGTKCFWSKNNVGSLKIKAPKKLGLERLEKSCK